MSNRWKLASIVAVVGFIFCVDYSSALIDRDHGNDSAFHIRIGLNLIYALELAIGLTFALYYLIPESRRGSRLGRVASWLGLTLLFLPMLAALAGLAGAWNHVAASLGSSDGTGLSPTQLKELGNLAQWLLALMALALVILVYRSVFETYWELAHNSLVLAFLALALLGLGLGWVLQGYGLISLFWGDGSLAEGEISGPIIVPFLSAFMIVVSLAVLLLCAYFSYTVTYDSNLSGTGGLTREQQLSRRVLTLWAGLPPCSSAREEHREPGYFVWLGLRPFLLLLALPAALPVLAVSRDLTSVSRGAWIVGLACSGWVFHGLLVRRQALAWVVRNARPPKLRESEPDYPMTLGARGLLLVVGPLIASLVAAHALDFAIHSESQTFAGILLLIWTSVGWLTIRSLNWPRKTLLQYLVVVLFLTVVPGGLTLIFSAGLDIYIAAPFGICCLILFSGVLTTLGTAYVSGFILREDERRSRLNRRTYQAGFFALVALLIYWNGTSRSRWPNIVATEASLSDFDRWWERSLTRVKNAAVEPNFGWAALLDDRAVLETWAQKHPRADSDEAYPVGGWRDLGKKQAVWEIDSSKKPKLVVVTTSGGGLRAGVWAEKVLLMLEEGIPELPDRTRLVTGSSGGMLGAALWVTGLERDAGGEGSVSALHGGLAGSVRRENADASEEVIWKARDQSGSSSADVDRVLARDLKHDFLTPVVYRMVFGDLTGLRLPGLAGDRGQVLEERFYDSSGQTAGMNISFAELARRGETEGRIPSLVFTPMLVEDSRRLIISGLDLGRLALNHSNFDPLTSLDSFQRGSQFPDPDFPAYSCSGVQLFQLFPTAFSGIDSTRKRPLFPVGRAVRMNATFPYVTPAVELPTARGRRAVDAGYFDNYGVDLAVSWLEMNRRWLELNTSGVILVQIRAFSNESQLKDLDDGHVDSLIERVVGDPIGRGVQFLTTPLAAMGAARMNVNYYRNDAAVENLKRDFTFDMLERLSGVPYRDRAGDAEGNPKLYNPRELEQLAQHYPKASTFFRVLIFTCNDAQNKQPAQETLNWYLDNQEFQEILENWETRDNYRRFQYLKQVFRRVIEQDNEPTVKGEPARAFAGWKEIELQDPNSGVVGRGSSISMSEGGDSPFVWSFKDVPRGTYRVSVNLPLPLDSSRDWGAWPGKTTLAPMVRYVATRAGEALGHAELDLRARYSTFAEAKGLPRWWRDRFERNAEEFPGERNGLGRWFELDFGPKSLEVPLDGPVEFSLSLPAGLKGGMIADSIRLERIRERSDPPRPVDPTLDPMAMSTR